MTKQERVLKLVKLYEEVDESSLKNEGKTLVERAREGLLGSKNIADQMILIFAELLECTKRMQMACDPKGEMALSESADLFASTADVMIGNILEFLGPYAESLKEASQELYAKSLREFLKVMLSMRIDEIIENADEKDVERLKQEREVMLFQLKE